MSFDTDILKEGWGRALRFDFSVDDFSTVLYRLSDTEGKLDGTNWYSPRVVSCGAFRRALGQSRIAASGGVELVIANHDGAYDALASRTSMADISKMRVRAYLVLYSPAAPGSMSSQKHLGEYVIDRWPRRTDSTISISLADDILGPLSQGVTLPTILDWSAVGNASNNPLNGGAGHSQFANVHTPIQLAFGEDWVTCMPFFIPRAGTSSNYWHEVIVPICCTTDTSTAASDSEITEVRVELLGAEGARGPLVDIPRVTRLVPNPASPGSFLTRYTWYVERSPTITKDGKNFVVIYLRFKTDAVANVLLPYADIQFSVDEDGNMTSGALPEWWASNADYPPDTEAQLDFLGRRMITRINRIFVKGFPLSARTYTATSQQHAADVIKDIVTQYSKGTFACNDTARAAVKGLRATARAAGVVQPWESDMKQGGRSFVSTSAVRPVLTHLCQSSDLDVFVDWNGDVSFSTDGYSFATAAAILDETLVELEESRAWDVSDWIPSIGERGAPYNRLWLEGGKESRGDNLPLQYQGPFDFDASRTIGIPMASRVVEATLQQGWRPYAQQAVGTLGFRVLEVLARPRIRFRYFLDALRLDLGDFFKMSWGRNVGGPYATAALWQVESITYAPSSDTVEIEAAWRDDMVERRGYLLDDMTMTVRVTATFGRTVTVQDDNDTVTFASGSLVSDGVAAGDILVLQDATQADDVYTRNQAIRILSVDSATTLAISAGYDFSSPGGVAVSSWTIRRGATTYHTAVSDPTNYPSGGTMYGKVSDADGEYSDATGANLLLDG